MGALGEARYLGPLTPVHLMQTIKRKLSNAILTATCMFCDCHVDECMSLVAARVHVCGLMRDDVCGLASVASIICLVCHLSRVNLHVYECMTLVVARDHLSRLSSLERQSTCMHTHNSE